MPHGEVAIGVLGAAHVPSIVAILQANFRSEFRRFITDQQIEYMLANIYSPGALTQDMDGGEAFVGILHGDDLRGFASYRQTPRPGELQMHRLYVNPRWHGAGYGGVLIEHVQEYARREGFTTLMLTVNKRNAPAIAVYQKRGFEITAATTIDIGQGFFMDDYVLTKPLA